MPEPFVERIRWARALLGFPEDLNVRTCDVQRAFRRLSLEVHPDKRPNCGGEDQKRLCQARDQLMESAHARLASHPPGAASPTPKASAPKASPARAAPHFVRAAPYARGAEEYARQAEEDYNDLIRRWIAWGGMAAGSPPTPKDPAPKAAPARAAPQRRSFSSGCAWPPPSGLATSEAPPETEEEYKEMYGQGYNMLKKMGFQVGSGCGRDGQGSLRPVEAVEVERGHGGLGWRPGVKRPTP